jgi:hypothetical protein
MMTTDKGLHGAGHSDDRLRMMIDRGEMTQPLWDSVRGDQRARVYCQHGLTTALIGLEGKRVEAVTNDGETRRFWVGRSTGWRPCHLEIKTRRSSGGGPADSSYRNVTVIHDGRLGDY